MISGLEINSNRFFAAFVNVDNPMTIVPKIIRTETMGLFLTRALKILNIYSFF